MTPQETRRAIGQHLVRHAFDKQRARLAFKHTELTASAAAALGLQPGAYWTAPLLHYCAGLTSDPPQPYGRMPSETALYIDMPEEAAS